jgi:antitoxin PrlF
MEMEHFCNELSMHFIQPGHLVFDLLILDPKSISLALDRLHYIDYYVMHMTKVMQKFTIMPAIQATITGRGQITLPVAIRRQLGVKPGGKIIFKIEGNGTVSVDVAPFTFQTVRASVPPLPRPLTEEVMTDVIADARTARYRRTQASTKL